MQVRKMGTAIDGWWGNLPGKVFEEFRGVATVNGSAMSLGRLERYPTAAMVSAGRLVVPKLDWTVLLLFSSHPNPPSGIIASQMAKHDDNGEWLKCGWEIQTDGPGANISAKMYEHHANAGAQPFVTVDQPWRDKPMLLAATFTASRILGVRISSANERNLDEATYAEPMDPSYPTPQVFEDQRQITDPVALFANEDPALRAISVLEGVLPEYDFEAGCLALLAS